MKHILYIGGLLVTISSLFVFGCGIYVICNPETKILCGLVVDKPGWYICLLSSIQAATGIIFMVGSKEL